MFRLFQSILDCGSCKKAGAKSPAQDDLASEEAAPQLEHVKSLGVIAGSLGSSSCTMIGGVIISGANGAIRIKAPGSDAISISGNGCHASKQKDQYGNFYVDITISPGGELVQYNTKDKQLLVSEPSQLDQVSALKL